jgi:hypothetical protein
MNKKTSFFVIFVITGIAIFFLSIYAIFQIWGYLTYETKAEKELWIAENKIHISDEPRFSFGEETIVIEKKEGCVPLRTIHEKDFDYTEIFCENGQGWVTTKSDFKIIRPRETNSR